MVDRIKTCFIAAPANADVRQIRDSLKNRDVEVIGLPNFDLSKSVEAASQTSIATADIVVGVLDHRNNAGVMFELGVAAGKSKPIIIFAPPKFDIMPFDLQRFLVVRTSLQNREAIDFAFDQVIASSAAIPRPASTLTRQRSHRSLEAASYHDELDVLLKSQNWQQLENLVARAIRETGVDVVAEARSSGHIIDLVVWSDELQPYVGNPFPMEIKGRLASRDAAKNAVRQAAAASKSIGSSWSMLLYADGLSPSDRVWASDPSVLVMKIDELFNQLKHTSFAHVVLRQRNRRAHGLEA